jgi:hypothetical protein
MTMDDDSIVLPDWIPLPIIREIHRLVDDDLTCRTPAEKAVAAALCIDERMETVWREIFRKSERGGFLYPAKIGALNPYSRALEWEAKLIRSFERARDDRFSPDIKEGRQRARRNRNDEARATEALKLMSPDLRQELACMYVYTTSLHASQRVNLVTNVDLRRADLFVGESVEQLKALAPFIESLNLGNAEKEFRRSALAIERVRNGPFHVERHSRDDRVRAFAIAVGAETRRLFGETLCGVVAALANVSFDRRDLTNLRVREFIRNAEKQATPA